mmetsp:Transcript_88865/g.185724  ORF Transcript_88865/g.185724 Transcript_88865/m.185724 type:complete len:743 (-) Transcript_88865:125-2353(-)
MMGFRSIMLGSTLLAALSLCGLWFGRDTFLRGPSPTKLAQETGFVSAEQVTTNAQGPPANQMPLAAATAAAPEAAEGTLPAIALLPPAKPAMALPAAATFPPTEPGVEMDMDSGKFPVACSGKGLRLFAVFSMLSGSAERSKEALEQLMNVCEFGRTSWFQLTIPKIPKQLVSEEWVQYYLSGFNLHSKIIPDDFPLQIAHMDLWDKISQSSTCKSPSTSNLFALVLRDNEKVNENFGVLLSNLLAYIDLLPEQQRPSVVLLNVNQPQGQGNPVAYLQPGQIPILKLGKKSEMQRVSTRRPGQPSVDPVKRILPTANQGFYSYLVRCDVAWSLLGSMGRFYPKDGTTPLDPQMIEFLMHDEYPDIRAWVVGTTGALLTRIANDHSSSKSAITNTAVGPTASDSDGSGGGSAKGAPRFPPDSPPGVTFEKWVYPPVGNPPPPMSVRPPAPPIRLKSPADCTLKKLDLPEMYVINMDTEPEKYEAFLKNIYTICGFEGMHLHRHSGVLLTQELRRSTWVHQYLPRVEPHSRKNPGSIGSALAHMYLWDIIGHSDFCATSGNEEKYVLVTEDDEMLKTNFAPHMQSLLAYLGGLPSEEKPDLVILNDLRPHGTQMALLEPEKIPVLRLIKMPSDKRGDDFYSPSGKPWNGWISAYLIRCRSSDILIQKGGPYANYDGTDPPFDHHIFQMMADSEYPTLKMDVVGITDSISQHIEGHDSRWKYDHEGVRTAGIPQKGRPRSRTNPP